MTTETDIDARAWLAWASSFQPRRWSSIDDFERHLAMLPDDTDLNQRPSEFCDAEAMKDPPEFIYLRGRSDLASRRPRIAIVGSRDIDFEGTRLATSLARDIAQRGGVVVSGGARGTDGIAHRAALDAHGHTICVLPCGIDVSSPSRHRQLFDEIASSGLLLSSYPPGTRPRKYFYHARNELIVALSDAVVVVRARARSGSRLTGEHALRMGVPLWVVPGSPDDPHSEGCLDLADAGARLYRGPESLEAYFESGRDAPDEDDPTDALPGLDDVALDVIRALSRAGGRATVDALAEATCRATSAVASIVMELELWGYCHRDPGSPFLVLNRRLLDDASR